MGVVAGTHSEPTNRELRYTITVGFQIIVAYGSGWAGFSQI